MHNLLNRSPNRIQAALRERKPIYGLYLTVPCPELVEIAGLVEGIAYLHIDGEHGPFSLRDVEHCCRAAELMGLTTLARTPDSEPATINGYLDRGVRAIILPHLTTVAAAERAAAACRYAPDGTRSYGAVRANYYAMFSGSRGEHLAELNADRTVCGLIEDREGYDNLDALLKVKGIDTWSVGTSDLAQSLGHPGDPRHPDVVRVVEDIYARIEAAGLAVRDKVLVSLRDKLALPTGLKAMMAQG